MQIGRDEYKKLLDSYVKEELEKSEKKPSGMFGTWAFRAAKEKEFKKKLEEQKVEVISS